MKKRDLLLAGLFLCTIPAFGQPGVDRPLRYSDDAKMIFMQNFEKADPTKFNQENGILLNKTNPKRPTTLYTWSDTPVDRIEKVTYYKRDGSSQPSGVTFTNFYDGKDKQWSIAGIRDTLMLLYDGIVKTDAEQPDDSLLAYDQFYIQKHTTETQQGTKGLDRFGEDGGKQYFQYKSATSTGINGKNVANNSTSDGGYVPEYRRNLFVRNIPIEESSSYRVTVFVKPTKLAEASVPRIGLDLMRGYFHSEKPFIADPNGRTTSSWWGTTTSYDAFEGKSNYTTLEEGTWNKITLMSYYNNDSIGNVSAYLMGYYWAGDWNWKVQRDADGNVVGDLGRNMARNAAGELVQETDPTKIKDTVTLTFIQQPDKYFVRLSFRSDSTQFDVDNLSLTKSWIGGVEHHNDLIRVDFGYQTNMGDLAQAALEKNKIAAVELPGKYFEVWGRFLDESTGERYWMLVPINSAEYHGDGYMYMWTKPWEDDGSLRSFEGADSVLVTFRNPIDRDDLKLKYTGNAYPNGQNKEWQADKEKRLVFDFHNEISSLNPNIDFSNGKKVLSLKDLPPVVQRMPYVDGTFGLDPNLREMTFKFSRHLCFKNTGNEATNVSFIKVVGGGATEYWEFKQYADAADTNTVIVRPQKYNTPLSGDYKITIDQITHLEGADRTDADQYGADVVLNLHFGDFDLNSIPQVVTFSNWRDDINNYDGLGQDNCPVPTSVYLHTGSQAFAVGTGDKMTKCGFYPTKDDTITVLGTRIPDNGMFYLAGQKGTGNLYSIVNLNKGYYAINFKLAGRNTTNYPMGLKFYAKPTGTLEDGNDNGFKTLDGVANKTVLEAGKNPAVNMGYQFPNTKTWDAKTITCSYTFYVPANGDYVFEWTVSGNDNNGIVIGNYWITTDGDLSFGPVGKVNAAIADAAKAIAKADAAPKLYQGTAYESLKNVKAAAEGFIPAKKATGINLPSEYSAEAEAINKAVSAFNSRVALVDGFLKTLDDAQAKYDLYQTADSLKEYKTLPDVQALLDLKNSYANYDYSSKNDAAVTAENNKVQAAINGIDKRVALAEIYPQAITYAKAMKDTAIVKGLDHAALDAAIAAADEYNDGAATFAQLKSYMVALTDLAFATIYKDTINKLSVRRIQELDALAKSLGATYPEGVAARITAAQSDDDELADIIKCAIKIAIYDKIVKGETVENIDLTPFIKNYYLYATVKGIVDNSALNIYDKREDAHRALQAVYQIQKTGHTYGDEDLGKMVWVLMLDQEFTDLYPGWTVQSFTQNGHSMVTPDEGYKLLSKDTLVNQGMVLDGKLAMDWNSKAELKQTIEGLPYGEYSLSSELTNTSHDNGNTVANITINGYNNSTTVTTKATKVSAKVDNISIVDATTVDLDVVVTTGSSGGTFDNLALTYVGKYDDPWYYEANNYYATLLDNAQKELDNLVTIVDKAKAVAAGVEYFTISGIKLDAPKAGEILIRKTTNGNGKVVVDKVIIK